MDVISSSFLNAVLNGRMNSASEWHTYFETFHHDNPTANDLFTTLRTFRAETSYDVLAREVALLGQHILEIACGDGHFAEALGSETDPREGFTLNAIDVCRAELTIAEHRMALDAQIAFTQADAAALPFDDGSFDVVTSHQFVNFLPLPLPYLAEAARVLKRGGWLTFAINRGWLSDRANTWSYAHEAARKRLTDFYPKLVWPTMYDRRIYSDEGIEEILSGVLSLNQSTIEIKHFTVFAMMTPARIAEVYNRLYLFASVPERPQILEAVEEKAAQLADDDGTVEIAIPFRLVTVQKR